METTIMIHCKVAKWWYVALKILPKLIRVRLIKAQKAMAIARKLAHRAIKFRIGKERKWRSLQAE